MAVSIIRLNPDPDGFGDKPDELEAASFSSDIPLQHSHSVYEDDDIGLYVGVWDTEAMVEAGGPYACDEFMWLLEGQCDIRNNKTGDIETVKAGRPFVIPKGYDCQWQQSGYLRKYYVISEHPVEGLPAQPAHDGIVIPREDMSYEDTTGRFYSGLRTLEAHVSELLAHPHNEFACIKSGSITLTDERGVNHEFEAGDAYFIPQGVLCSIAVEARVSMYIALIQPG